MLYFKKESGESTVTFFLLISSVARKQWTVRENLQDPAEQPERGSLPATVCLRRPSGHILLFRQVNIIIKQLILYTTK